MSLEVPSCQLLVLQRLTIALTMLSVDCVVGVDNIIHGPLVDPYMHRVTPNATCMVFDNTCRFY